MFCSLNLVLVVYFLKDIHFSWTVNKNDFYDYTKAIAFDKQSVKLESTELYPHWSDRENKQIDLVSSGIARFSGLSGVNTLDVLIYATKLPMSNKNVRYEQIPAPSAQLNSNLVRDLAGLAPSDFTARHVTIATWVDVAFMPTMLSSFQMVFATDGNTTYVMLLIDDITHENSLPYGPEIDFRYAYEEGTRFQRLGFLRTVTGVSTRSKEAPVAAIENTNCQKPGRWCFRATDTPIPKVVVTTVPPVVPPVSADVKNSSSVGIKGAFTFTQLGLEGNTIVDGKNNDELSIILTKKNADQRYGQMTDNLKLYISKVYKNAANVSNADVTVLSYRMGSLIVEYSVDTNSSLCNGNTGQKCIKDVQEKVAKEVSTAKVQSGALTGTIDTEKVVVEDFDECSTGTYCDFNADCFDYPNLLTFGCKCKEGFVGDGFPGNCRPKYASFHFTSIVMYIAIVVVILSIAFVTVVFYKVYKNDEEVKEIEEDKYSGHQTLGWHTRNPYGYGYTGNVYQRRFTDH